MSGPAVTVPPAFYARRGGLWADWWTLLHPPYTAWHLSYVVIGACIAPHVDWWVLGATVGAFALAIGVAAHALDELQGRPLSTRISASNLRTAAVLALSGAVAIGLVMLPRIGWPVVPLIAVGVLCVVGYNLELFGGRLHTDLGFAASWGGFPVLTGWVAQRPPITAASLGAVGAAVLACTALSLAQRRLSTPARELRRRVRWVHGRALRNDGTAIGLDRSILLAPLEATLRAMTLGVVLIATTLVLYRLS